MRNILIEALEHGGIKEIREARDGTEAVEAVKNEDFDLVLMDWNMPNMLGIDAVKEIRAAGNQTPIIMVTPEAGKESVLEAMKCGVNNYVIKPFNAAVLIEKINETLEKA